MREIKIAVAGVGNRGKGMLANITAFDNVKVIALCDMLQERLDEGNKKLEEVAKYRAKTYLDFDEMLKDDEIEAVYIASSWETHISMAIRSLYAHKITAMEVGGAYDVSECFDLVKAYEETKTPFMFMENCCFDRFELLNTSIARKGMFGEIVHCHGAYCHDLRDEIMGGNVNTHYRLRNYMMRNCENYPTHEIGPIAKLLDINRGNKFLSLSSFSSKACGLKEYSYKKENPDHSLEGINVKQGDVVTTVIKCANGETITLTLNTTLPRYYSREFQVCGTKGMSNGDYGLIITEEKGDISHAEAPWVLKDLYNNSIKYDEYLPDIWKNITPEEEQRGHGGMDYFMFKTFFECIEKNEEMPIDVYDAAAWMSITALSEESISLGSMPVMCPDFTKGKWTIRKRKDVVKF